MTCEECEDLMAARLDDALPDGGAERIAAHLEACPECRTLEAGLAPTLFPLVDAASYDVGPVIGYGGMGQVRIARDLRLGRLVAIKELLFPTGMMRARFAREVRVAAELQHPNIVPVYDVGTWADGTPFYTMRLVQGRSLFAAISAAGALEDRVALLHALIAATDAVAYAHARGVVHRDLTPSNILLGEFGETVVIDWGLAKGLRSDALASLGGDELLAPRRASGLTAKELTAPDDILGCPAYMPREQAAGERIDERSDVYALGAIAYHLLAGRAPYAGADRAVLEEVRRAPPMDIQRAAPRAPRILASIVAKAMAREPEDRYPSAQALASDLRRFQAGLLVEAHRYSLRETITRWTTGRRASLAAAAALVGVAIHLGLG